MQVQNDAQPYDTINITPMLDLAYVLLVIFILMTTAGVQGLTMNLPKPSNKPSAEKHDVIIVQVTASGLMVNGAGISQPELEGKIAETKARDPKFSIMIKGDADAPYEAVVGVIDMMTRLQIENVGLATGKIGT